MITSPHPAHQHRWVFTLLTAVLVVAIAVFGAGPALAATTSAAQNAVGASISAAPVAVGLSTDITAGQRLGSSPPQFGIAVATGVAANTAAEVPELAAYGGGKTSGVLVRSDGTATNLTSGLDGPSALLPKPRPGMNGNIVGHVESHAAAVMRQEGLDEATLWINRMPCGGPNGCMVNLSRMVPSGSTLNVFVTPGGSAGGLEDWLIVTGTG